MAGCAGKFGSLGGVKDERDPALAAVSELRTFSDINQIAFEWDAVTAPTAQGYLLYRELSNGSFKQVAKINDRFATHHTDTGLEPATSYAYFIEAFSDNGTSAPSPVVRATTQPRPDAVGFVQVLDNLPARIKLLWAPHADTRVSGYVIERSEVGAQNWREVARIDGRLSVEFIDSGLKENARFAYRVVARTFDGISSQPSAAVQSAVKPLPQAVANLAASTNLPRQIKLSWQHAPREDFSHYNIYRKGTFAYSLIATSKTAAYTDKLEKDGESYHYKVAAVDTDGQESAGGIAVTGATLAAPAAPAITHAAQQGSAVRLAWASADGRAVGYVVKKTFKGGEREFNVKAAALTDGEVAAGEKYAYRVYAVDKFGLVSEASKEASVVVK